MVDGDSRNMSGGADGPLVLFYSDFFKTDPIAAIGGAQGRVGGPAIAAA